MWDDGSATPGPPTRTRRARRRGHENVLEGGLQRPPRAAGRHEGSPSWVPPWQPRGGGGKGPVSQSGGAAAGGPPGLPPCRAAALAAGGVACVSGETSGTRRGRRGAGGGWKAGLKGALGTVP